MDLTGKTALITGSTDGLGKVTATLLAKAGLNIIIHGRDETKVKAVISEIESVSGDVELDFIISDLSNIAANHEKFSEIKELDILINNAGLWEEGATTDVPLDRLIEVVNVNFTSYLVLTRKLLPILEESEYGQILNVISVAGYEIPTEYYHTVYSATKFGLQGFSESLAKEYEGKNLRIMGYYPGGMTTDLFKKAGEEYKTNEPWMFPVEESAEAIKFMLTRSRKTNMKRMDLVNQLFN
jgi:short-subunit dehydrogenase